jgi:plasmid stabilization system protein ParE
MRLRVTPNAFQDINDIEAYLKNKTLNGIKNVVSSLKHTFEIIRLNPKIGRLTDRDGVRKFVNPDYGFVILYNVNGTDVWILRVYHPRRLREDVSKVELP